MVNIVHALKTKENASEMTWSLCFVVVVVVLYTVREEAKKKAKAPIGQMCCVYETTHARFGIAAMPTQIFDIFFEGSQEHSSNDTDWSTYSTLLLMSLPWPLGRVVVTKESHVLLQCTVHA